MKTAMGYLLIFLGFMMAGMWTFLLATGQVPEWQTTPYAITFHLIAEFTTAIMLLLSGILLLRKNPLAKKVALLGMGFYVYAVIQAAGYFIQQGATGISVMFGIFSILGSIFIGYLMKTD